MTELNELDDLYQEIILDHYRHPRNQQSIGAPDMEAHALNPFCGDEVDLQARLEDGRFCEVCFKGRGCSISQASASIMSELLKGRTPEEALELYAAFRRLMQGEDLSEEELDGMGELGALAGVRKFPVRIKCALLGWNSLDDAIEEYAKANG